MASVSPAPSLRIRTAAPATRAPAVSAPAPTRAAGFLVPPAAAVLNRRHSSLRHISPTSLRHAALSVPSPMQTTTHAVVSVNRLVPRIPWQTSAPSFPAHAAPNRPSGSAQRAPSGSNLETTTMRYCDLPFNTSTPTLPSALFMPPPPKRAHAGTPHAHAAPSPRWEDYASGRYMDTSLLQSAGIHVSVYSYSAHGPRPTLRHLPHRRWTFVFALRSSAILIAGCTLRDDRGHFLHRSLLSAASPLPAAWPHVAGCKCLRRAKPATDLTSVLPVLRPLARCPFLPPAVHFCRPHPSSESKPVVRCLPLIARCLPLAQDSHWQDVGEYTAHRHLASKVLTLQSISWASSFPWQTGHCR
ncbi:hypothetical protein GGX14DRAFT_572440 [Mycena pura]|uniref:Uncharacterized protein n=1 Tax=Mycena pura TaxID=153505 RepID=A0AAD6V556_9AGAR|nr:hypothetical protein GGX14DRAFT_572440 [Mycena pura]